MICPNSHKSSEEYRECTFDNMICFGWDSHRWDSCPIFFGPWESWRSAVCQIVFDRECKEWIFLFPADVDDCQWGPYELPVDLIASTGWSM